MKYRIVTFDEEYNRVETVVEAQSMNFDHGVLMFWANTEIIRAFQPSAWDSLELIDES